MKQWIISLFGAGIIIGLLIFCMVAVADIGNKYKAFEQTCHNAGGYVVGSRNYLCIDKNGTILPIEY